MASTLERAATNVAACLVDAPVAPTFSMADVNGWTEEKAYEIARAVLMAVREPDDRVRYNGDRALVNATTKGGSITDTVLIIHQAMIDAILNEKDTTND